jgi:hypothetical protein
MKVKFAVLLMLAGLVLLLPGCELLEALGLLPTPQELLIGTWRIDHTRTNPADPAIEDSHYEIRFTADEFFIEDTSSNVTERDTITAIDDVGFYCTIEVYLPDPALVGGENYALYVIDGDTLEVAFYDDDTLADRFITFYADRVD